MKIFGIGLSRTGTTSLTRALQILGYSAVHFPRTIQQIENNEASADTTIAMGYAFLDAMYPDSKFILTVRKPKSWFVSMTMRFGTVWHPEQSVESKVGHWLYHGYPPKLDNHLRLCAIFEEHNERAEKYFASQPHRFLKLNICDGEGWDKLCSFLGKEIPNVPFPHENSQKLTVA